MILTYLLELFISDITVYVYILYMQYNCM